MRGRRVFPAWFLVCCAGLTCAAGGCSFWPRVLEHSHGKYNEALKQVTEVLYQFSRIPAELLGVFALASLLVATMGLYAVMAYAVTERSREFALRMAVGATRAQIVRLVVNGGLETVAAGLLIGGVGSFFAIRLLRSLLFGVAPFDPVSFIAAALVLMLTVLVAGLAPAGRAASIQPMEALRNE